MRNWQQAGRGAIDGGYNFGGFPTGEVGAGIGSYIGSLFGKKHDPFAAQQEYSEQIPGMLEGVYQPYMQRGQRLAGTLEEQFQKMMGDPSGQLAQFGEGFQQDPGYKFQVQQATEAANRAAAAGGMLGTPAEQTSLAGTINQLANQQYQQYLHNVQGLQAQGIQGLGGLQEQGFGAAKSYGSAMSDYLQAQAQAAAAESEAKRTQAQSTGGAIGGILGDIIGFL